MRNEMEVYEEGLYTSVGRTEIGDFETLNFERMRQYYKATRNIDLVLKTSQAAVKGVSKKCIRCVQVCKWADFIYTTVNGSKIRRRVNTMCYTCYVEINTGVCSSCRKTFGPGNWLRKNGERSGRCLECIAAKIRTKR